MSKGAKQYIHSHDKSAPNVTKNVTKCKAMCTSSQPQYNHARREKLE